MKKAKDKTKAPKKELEEKKRKGKIAQPSRKIKPSSGKEKKQTKKSKGGALLESTEKKPEGETKSVSELDWKEEIKKMLLQMRKELLQEVSKSIKTESDYLRFDVGDFYDHASSDRDRELSLMLTDRERNKLIQIEEALRRIEEGSYGICESCGDEIGEDRLKAMPFAKLCLSCKIDLERQGGPES